MKHRVSPFLFALCLVLTACTPHSSPQDIPSISLPHSSSAANCRFWDFNAFWKAFANDVAIQKAFVTDPLQSEFMDIHAQPEPALVTKMLSVTELQFPLIPNIQQQAKDGLVATQTSLGAEEISVKLAKEDTDYQMTFFFRKNDGCWKLYRLKNDSL